MTHPEASKVAAGLREWGAAAAGAGGEDERDGPDQSAPERHGPDGSGPRP